MSRIPVTKSTGEIPDVESGTYLATCVRVKDDTIENPQFGNGDVVRLYMALADVLDAEGEEIELDGMANRKLTPKSKLTRWAEALGRAIDFDNEDDFDPEELIGSQCLIKVVRADKDSWPKIEDMTAPPKTRATRQAAPPTADNGISNFWAATRKAGVTLEDVKLSSNDMFGKAPADLTPDQRTELLEALQVPF